ncbi:hypothetical protein GCM10010517_37730 [Streptosporangium fragile]|uniref:Anti-sigma factor antagonist n=1 Tax=Streptosporangium fragile TaxID=46186 RepID=A0ABN3W176_9ACTN
MVDVRGGSEFHVRADRHRHGTALYATGALDYASSRLLKEGTDAALRAEDRPHLVIDLTGVTFCDSTGYGTLIYALTRVRAVGGTLVLVGPSTTMRERLSLLGVEELFDIRRTVEETVAPCPGEAVLPGERAPARTEHPLVRSGPALSGERVLAHGEGDRRDDRWRSEIPSRPAGPAYPM